jgi:hypothetical protein
MKYFVFLELKPVIVLKFIIEAYSSKYKTSILLMILKLPILLFSFISSSRGNTKENPILALLDIL